MKRIVFILDNFPAASGEISFIFPELKAFRGRFEITLVCRRAPEGEPQPVPDWVDAIYLPTRTEKRRYLRSFFRADFYGEMLSLIRRGRFSPARLRRCVVELARSATLARALEDALPATRESLILYPYWGHSSASACVLLKRKWHVPVVTRMHGYDLFEERNDWGYQPLKRMIAYGVDRILFVSSQGRAYFHERFRVPPDPDRFQLRHLGSPDSGLSPENATDTLQLVSCSNIVAVKRVHLLVDALSEIVDVPIHWTHFGDGNLRAEIEAYAREMLSGHTNIRYTFAGWTDNEDLLNYYRTHAVDLFITATQSEGGMPVSISEALSFGIPAAATAVGGVPDGVLDGETGWLIDPDDAPAGLRRAIMECREMDPAARARLRANCRRLWSERFDAEKNAAEVEKLFETL